MAWSNRQFVGVVSFVSGCVNLAAIAGTGLLLAPGTSAGGEIGARAAYLAANRPAIAVGWLLWMGATLALLAHFVGLRALLLDSPGAVPNRGVREWILRYVVALATIGAALDLIADLILMAILPPIAEALLARPGDPALTALFRTWDELAVGLTGGVAGTLYVLAGAAVTWLLFRAGAPRTIVGLGAGVWGAAGLTPLAVAFLPAALPVTVALSIVLYVAWAWLIAAWCWPVHRKPPPARRAPHPPGKRRPAR